MNFEKFVYLRKYKIILPNDQHVKIKIPISLISKEKENVRKSFLFLLPFDQLIKLTIASHLRCAPFSNALPCVTVSSKNKVEGTGILGIRKAWIGEVKKAAEWKASRKEEVDSPPLVAGFSATREAEPRGWEATITSRLGVQFDFMQRLARLLARDITYNV